MGTNGHNSDANEPLGFVGAPADDDLDALCREAMRAEAFERWTVGDAAEEVAPITIRRRAGGVWWWAGTTAAAAALGLAVVMVRMPTPAPVGPIASNDAPRHESRAVIEVAEPAHDVNICKADAHDVEQELSRWSFLDPGIMKGLPTLTSERSLVLAVYPNSQSECECVTWAVRDAEASGGDGVAARAVSTPCADGGVVLVSVSGPRELLPTHDGEAHELAECFADAGDEDAWRTDPLLAAASAAECLPDGLRVLGAQIVR